MTPYARGAADAFEKFAVDANLASHVAELGGLGLLTVPALHHLIKKDSSGTDRALAGVELAGLGVLAAPSIHHLIRS